METPLFTISTDSSTTGWGAVFKNTSTVGHFNLTESLMHINVLELKAILFWLRSLRDHICDSLIKILSDNATAVYCTNNVESCRSVDCDKITKSIWDRTIKRRLWLSSAYIPGRLNRDADEKSRKTQLRIEWKLNSTIFHNMLEYFQYYPEIDLFASRLNAQLLRFFSYRQDPFAEITNAFSISWEDKKFYCFLPFAYTAKTLQKFFVDEATGLLVVPNWPTQIWFPFLMNILISEPFIIPPSINQLELPSNMKKIHLVWRRLELMGCNVSGKGM